MKTTIELIEMRALVAVVRAGSFTAAADVLDTDKAHVSRIISRLEEKLGAQLLVRSTRRLNVTEIGREVTERASGILAALDDTQALAANAKREPAGTFRITAGSEFGMLRVNRWITSFLSRHPSVRVEAEFTNRVIDVIHEGFDIAIRIGPLPDSELSARRLGIIDYGLYASADYLVGRGTPANPAELAGHDLVMFAPRGKPEWTLVSGRDLVKIDAVPRYVVDNIISAREAAVAGLGIALLPTFVASDAVVSGGLTPLLLEWSRIPVPVHAVFASTRYMTPNVRTFIDLAVEQFSSAIP